ncbi:uncharacterized protein LOC129923908 [Biomphalaria glabrata]|uniref:Uncharacterized protein LOC129923908 n=1 Tax=Biomphalaria glabrata TaxID=6526 RepID=A0A9W2ZD99_BIOGL|nr:uncharacterized protein LOC129923908 [Biomphalaria glabrata]
MHLARPLLSFLVLTFLVWGAEPTISPLDVNCRKHPGFRIQQYGKAKKCLNWRGSGFNFETAKKECEGLGAFLATFKNVDERRIFFRYLYYGYYWIGLDDLQQEGVYIWHDDGKPILNMSVFDDFNGPREICEGEEFNCGMFVAMPQSIIMTKCAFSAAAICEVRK